MAISMFDTDKYGPAVRQGQHTPFLSSNCSVLCHCYSDVAATR